MFGLENKIPRVAGAIWKGVGGDGGYTGCMTAVPEIGLDAQQPNMNTQCALSVERVRIVGLQAKPEHNGSVGRAILFDRDAKRYGVELEGSGTTLKVREANLELVTEADE